MCGSRRICYSSSDYWLGLNVSLSSCSSITSASAVIFIWDTDRLMLVMLCSLLFSTLKDGFEYLLIGKCCFYRLSILGSSGVLLIGSLATDSKWLLLDSSNTPDFIRDLFSLPCLSLPFRLLSLRANGLGSICISLSFLDWSRSLSLYGAVWTLSALDPSYLMMSPALLLPSLYLITLSLLV